MGELVVEIDDPKAADIRALLDRHRAFANQHSPPEVSAGPLSTTSSASPGLVVTAE